MFGTFRACSAGLLALAILLAGATSAVAATPKGSVELANGDLRKAVLADPGEPLPEGVEPVGGGAVVVEILFRDGRGGVARDAVAEAAGEITGSVPGELLQAEVPIDELVALEADRAVTYVRPPLDYSEPAERDAAVGLDALSPGTAGTFTGEQIAKTNADAWHAEGYTGAGVKVGIIDQFSLLDYNAAVAAGEIPAVSGTFCRFNGSPCGIYSSERHGIGVAETVVDMAPSVQIYFADATTASDTQEAMNYFAAQGVDVVTRSQTGRYDGPGDGTGPIASVIESSAVGQGMFYLNSAGNSAGRFGFNGSYWRGGWSDPDDDDFLNFSGGDELMAWDCSFQNGLRWSDFGEGSATTDYDLFVFNSVGPPPNQVDSSEDDQSAGAPPIELATGCTSGTNYIAIRLFAENGGTAGDVLEFMTNGASVEHDSNPYSATGPMADLDSPGAVSVGAVDPALGVTIAQYSSEGPSNDERIKPDLAAAACVETLTYQPGCFNGTSSSTPVAAGAAALALSGGAASTPQTIKSFLLGATVDRGASGADNVYGQGELLLPDPPDPPPPVDATPPSVTALNSKGKSGKRAKLRYRSFDDSGVSEETITVIRRGNELETIDTTLGEATGSRQRVRWRVPRRIKGKMRFCVAAADGSGNTSSTSCAKLKIKKKKRGRKQ